MPVPDELLVVSVVMPWHASAGTAAGAVGDAQGAGKRAGSHCQAGPAVAADLGHADIQQALACAAQKRQHVLLEAHNAAPDVLDRIAK